MAEKVTYLPLRCCICDRGDNCGYYPRATCQLEEGKKLILTYNDDVSLLDSVGIRQFHSPDCWFGWILYVCIFHDLDFHKDKYWFFSFIRWLDTYPCV